ncbi:MAG TPA: hypothetical protein VHN37_13330 [Actinomycetota bacterium]|nr:hypothetical protein [Actinomycetota bacterium]
MGWANPPQGAARVVLSDPEFAYESRVSAITVTTLDSEGNVIVSERVVFDPSPYLPTYDMLLVLRDKINAQLSR